jgi:hypothetical protein
MFPAFKGTTSIAHASVMEVMGRGDGGMGTAAEEEDEQESKAAGKKCPRHTG